MENYPSGARKVNVDMASGAWRLAPADIKFPELRSGRQVLRRDVADIREVRSPSQGLLQLGHGRIITTGHDFHRAIRAIPRKSAEAEPARLLQDKPPKADALHPARHEEAPGRHAASLRLPRRSSTMTGTTDSAMMARITRVKFERTAGMLPKKYPPSTKSDTQSTAPATLYARKRG